MTRVFLDVSAHMQLVPGESERILDRGTSIHDAFTCSQGALCAKRSTNPDSGFVGPRKAAQTLVGHNWTSTITVLQFTEPN